MILLIFFTYQILQLLSLPIIICIIIHQQIKRKVIGNLKQRLGLVPQSPSNKSVVWIHAVSVGEVLATQELVCQIKQRNPQAICYLTVGTVSGMRMAQKTIAADIISFLPYDFLICMLIAYHRINPSKLIIIESELWPNLIALAQFKNIQRILLNARINPYSRSRALRLRWFYKHLINCFDHVLAQSPHDQDEFKQIGVDHHKLTVLGNIKAFNVVAKKNHVLFASPQAARTEPEASYPTILVGSMHPGEDDIYLKLFAQLRSKHPALRLILAPRHFTWQNNLIEKVKAAGFTSFVWTDTNQLLTHKDECLAAALDALWPQHDIIIVCKLGELFTLYPHATLFALGGTFVPIGGHNLLEPAVWATPTLIGPYYQNCRDIADRLEQVNGIIKVESTDKLLPLVERLLNNKQERQAIGNNSYTWVVNEATAVGKILEKFI